MLNSTVIKQFHFAALSIHQDRVEQGASGRILAVPRFFHVGGENGLGLNFGGVFSCFLDISRVLYPTK